jgi:hypothetical protein
MHAHDILYTPLDTPDVPATDIAKLLEWVQENADVQGIPNRPDASQVSDAVEFYPWKLIYAKYKNVWQHDFDNQFPELANFFYSAYGLEESDIDTVVLLPVRNDFAGLGFWHSDPDVYGLRMYIKNEAVENFLFIKPTVRPYNVRPDFNGPRQNFNKVELQDLTLSAKLYSPNQTFFINNYRAVHAVNTDNPGTLRIAAIIMCKKTPRLTAHIHELIVKSAEKFKEFAIKWPKPVDQWVF